MRKINAILEATFFNKNNPTLLASHYLDLQFISVYSCSKLKIPYIAALTSVFFLYINITYASSRISYNFFPLPILVFFTSGDINPCEARVVLSV